MILTRSPVAHDELFEIWQWNVERYSVQHANDYLAFLNSSIDGLINSFRKCRHVPGRPDLQWTMIRRRSSGNGHVAVFRVVGETIRVLHVFHTAQDWQNQLETEDE